MKLLDILNSQSTLAELNNCKGLSSVTAYRIAKNIKLVNEELKDYNEQRIKLLEELANKDEDDKPIINEENGMQEYELTDENKVKLQEEIDKLLDEEINIDIKKVSLEQLDRAGLSPAQLSTIEFMIVIEE
jgi:hypothetical protein|nr:MAG TPA: Protein of unknown function (DUF1617) [Caudoviricetes sp.]